MTSAGVVLLSDMGEALEMPCYVWACRQVVDNSIPRERRCAATERGVRRLLDLFLYRARCVFQALFLLFGGEGDKCLL